MLLSWKAEITRFEPILLVGSTPRTWSLCREQCSGFRGTLATRRPWERTRSPNLGPETRGRRSPVGRINSTRLIPPREESTVAKVSEDNGPVSWGRRAPRMQKHLRPPAMGTQRASAPSALTRPARVQLTYNQGVIICWEAPPPLHSVLASLPSI